MALDCGTGSPRPCCSWSLAVLLLWPYYNFTFRFDPQELLAGFVDRDPPATMSAMHRALALRIKADKTNNWRIIQRTRVALQMSLIVLLLEILAWLMSIGGTGRAW
jgi:hypothetical protein